jgi:FKBP-type peptidyl-prolyl cis-trans isomerase FklB
MSKDLFICNFKLIIKKNKMKKVVVCMLTVATFFYASAQIKGKAVAKPAAVKPIAAKGMFKNLLDSFSYAVGFAVANNMKSQGVSNVNPVLLQKAVDDFYKGKEPLIASDKLNDVLQRQSQIFAKSKEDAVRGSAAGEIAKGRAFLEANKKRSGVIVLPSGLQYEVIKKADSATAKPLPTDNVTVNYIGSSIDGKEFENSYKSGRPATFQVTGVIRGWTEILQLMSVGDKWKVYIPTELAYNLNPRDPNVIAPGAALVFEIALEAINSTKGQ